ncbi:hypothetical protein D5S17_32870 [Pseudonocardiaceae bacterium YIM PH 21723]|nr:hypothetical protein D5S17_32870 [Pseudonocardiaceae bacterium YIM PH 21723]
MTRDDVIDLLEQLVRHDNRSVDEDDVLEWKAAADRQDWSKAEINAAMETHRLRCAAWMNIRHMQEDHIRPMRERTTAKDVLDEVTGADRAPAANPKQVRAHVATLYKSLGWDPKRSWRHRLRRACPTCRAGVGRPCTGPSGSTRPQPHAEREAEES